MTFRGTFKEIVWEQDQYHELLGRMIRRDLALRYKQAVMGVGWAVFVPIINTVVFSIIFTRIAPIDTDVPYPLYAFCGFLTWNFFASSLRFAVLSLTSNVNLVSKVYFPREILPFAAVAVCLVDLGVASLVLVGMLAYYGVTLTWYVLLLPLVVFVHVVFTASMALLLAMSNLFYRDVKYLFEVVITVWMFVTSVMYPVERVGGSLAVILRLNPMTPIIDAYRAVILHGQAPSALPFAAAGLASLMLLAVAWSAFHAAEFAFAENV